MKQTNKNHRCEVEAELRRKLLFANLRRDSLKAWQAVAVPKVKRVARRYVVP